jgi:hypothetical protein
VHCNACLARLLQGPSLLSASRNNRPGTQAGLVERNEVRTCATGLFQDANDWRNVRPSGWEPWGGAQMSRPFVVLALILAIAAIVFGNVLPARAGDGRGSFSIECPYDHTLRDDPIVYPNQPGVSHSHDFFGNVSTTANSTYDTMTAAGTSCGLAADTAGYWNPTAYINGVQVPAIRVSAYYFGAPSGNVSAFPSGLQMIAGNKDATARAQNPQVHWSCIKADESPLADHPYNCAPYGGKVTARIDFPTCWDGVGLSLGHTAYAVKNVCPSGWVRMPQLSYRIRWNLIDPCAGATPCTADNTPDSNVALHLSTGSGDAVTSSGAFYTLHADFWNTWQQASLQSLVTTCLNAHKVCGRQTG